MAYQVVVVSGDDQDAWDIMLQSELERLEAEGWLLCAMTTKTMSIQQTEGMGATAQEVGQFVLVLHKSRGK